MDIAASSHQGLVELAHRRSELSFHLLSDCLLREGFVARYAAVAAGLIGIYALGQGNPDAYGFSSASA